MSGSTVPDPAPAEAPAAPDVAGSATAAALPGTADPGPVGVRRRPLAMTVAAGLLYLAALDALLLAVLGLAFLGRLRAATRVGYGHRNNVEQLVSAATTGTVAITVGLVLLALNLALFATFDLRGSGIARLASWGVAGVGVLCCGGTGLADRYGGDPATPLAYPGWYVTLHGWLIAGEVGALLLAALLLALPPVHRFVAPRMVPAGARSV